MEARVVPPVFQKGRENHLTLWDMCRGVSISSKMAPFTLDPRRLASWRSQPDRSQFCPEIRTFISTVSGLHSWSRFSNLLPLEALYILPHNTFTNSIHAPIHTHSHSDGCVRHARSQPAMKIIIKSIKWSGCQDSDGLQSESFSIARSLLRSIYWSRGHCHSIRVSCKLIAFQTLVRPTSLSWTICVSRNTKTESLKWQRLQFSPVFGVPHRR